jgi:hypothetical protein
LAKAPVISTSLVPNHTMSEREDSLSSIYKNLATRIIAIPGVAFREIPMHSLNHLREEFLQLFKHLLFKHLRKNNSHRQSRLTLKA